MTERSASGSKAKGSTQVTTETVAGIAATEEKVVRMRHGFPAPDELELEQVGQDNEAVRQQLLAIERRAFEQSGRLDELRQEAALEDEGDADAATKQKIIDRLGQKLSK